MDACNNEHVPQRAYHMNGIDNSATRGKIITIMLSVGKQILLLLDLLYI